MQWINLVFTDLWELYYLMDLLPGDVLRGEILENKRWQMDAFYSFTGLS